MPPAWLSPEEWQAVALSLKVSGWAVLCSLPLGVLTAHALARWRFPGRQALNMLVHLPLILPPVVTGYLLLLAFGRQGVIGQWLEPLGVASTHTGSYSVEDTPPSSNGICQ